MIKKIGIASLILSGSMLAEAGNHERAQYFDCATNTGCQAIGEVRVRSNYANTKYPIIFVHGGFFTSQVFGINWWYGIAESLAKNGATVYQVEQSSVNDSYVRGEQVREQIELILSLTQAEKVNLYGHSHGGQSGRYMMETEPHSVASMTAIGAPHQGSEMADVVVGLSETVGEKPSNFVASVVNAMGSVLNFFSGENSTKDMYTQDSLATLKELSTAGAEEFNTRFSVGLPTSDCGEGEYVTQNHIQLYSWSGNEAFTNKHDPVDYVLGLTNLAFGDKENDGLTSKCSSHFGKVLRDDYRMNHADQINQFFGIVAWFEAHPKSVHRLQANRLKKAGL